MFQTIKVRQSGTGDDVQVETPFGSVHVSHNQGGQAGTARHASLSRR